MFVAAIYLSWPGNIRELRNVIERSIIVCDDYLTLSDLPVEIQSFSSSQKNLPQNEFELAGAERRHHRESIAVHQRK